MADGNEDERASAALGERKKFRKIITSAQPMNYLSEEAVFAAIKQEAQNIQSAGVQLLLEQQQRISHVLIGKRASASTAMLAHFHMIRRLLARKVVVEEKV